MKRTRIEWTDMTWNPITGCSPVSEGCENCYALRMAIRLKGRCGYPKDDPFRVTYHEDRILDPFGWTKPLRIFVCSMSDLFHPDVQDQWIQAVFETILRNKHHRFLILTKRPERMREIVRRIESDEECSYWDGDESGAEWVTKSFATVFSNVWLGVTAENQARADERIPILLDIPAAKHFVSVEPMLGRIDFEDVPVGMFGPLRPFGGVSENTPRLDWVICGGESGPGARPMHPDWARSLRDQCQEANVPFFFKSWGEYVVPEDGARACRVCGCTENNACDEGCWWVEEDLCSSCIGKKTPEGDRPVKYWMVGKRRAGRELDGRTWDEEPSVVEEAVK
jgi:protein gp37